MAVDLEVIKDALISNSLVLTSDSVPLTPEQMRNVCNTIDSLAIELNVNIAMVNFKVKAKPLQSNIKK